MCPGDGARAPERDAASPEIALPPGYTRDGVLGAGGFALVFDTRRAGVGARVAVKVARGTSELVAARFAREAETMALVGAPYVPALIDHGVTAEGRPFIAME